MSNIENRPESPASKIAIVTGAGSGIGRAVALALINNGYKVVLAGRRPERLAETLALSTATSQNSSIAIPTDVTQSDEVDVLFSQTLKQFGRLDLLFNNAGINMPSTPVDQVPVEAWERVVATNLTGMFLCIRAAFRAMKSQKPPGGRIINNGSISAHSPRPGSIAYTATKHAVTGLTKATNLDGREWNIACGQIDIGNANSDMVERMSTGVPQADGSIRPEPTMNVEAVSDAVLYMDGLPLEANVPFMTVMASKMPYIGRG